MDMCLVLRPATATGGCWAESGGKWGGTTGGGGPWKDSDPSRFRALPDVREEDAAAVEELDENSITLVMLLCLWWWP
jgi:hypothetical protein